MRSVSLLVFFLVGFAVAARAQQQEQKLMDRIERPNMGMTYNFEKSTFSGSKSFSSGKSANVKEFQFDQKFSAKDFNTKSYTNTKTAWFGNFKFSTKSADAKGKYEIPNASKAAPTKAVSVKEYAENDKKVATREYAGQRPFLKRGLSQDYFDTADQKGWAGSGKPAPGQDMAKWSGSFKPMTVDDIRTLLNKNK